MNSPTPEVRDPELVAALELAVRAHSKKHYNAGLHKGIALCLREMLKEMSTADCKKYQPLMTRLTLEATEAYGKSLDGRPR